MSMNETDRLTERGEVPTLGEKLKGEIEEVRGHVEAAHGKRHHDPAAYLEGEGEQMEGRIKHGLSQVTGDAIADAERAGVGGVLKGSQEHLHGVAEVAAGKAEAGLGRAFGHHEQEIKGLAKEADGRLEEAVGRAEEDASKEALHAAVRADAEYVKPDLR